MNPGAAGPDPLALPLHETAIVATAVITFAGIVRWFQAQRHLTAGNADAVGCPHRPAGGRPALSRGRRRVRPRGRQHPAGQGDLRREDEGGPRGRGGSERAPARRGHPARDQGRRRAGRLPLSPVPGGTGAAGPGKVGAGTRGGPGGMNWRVPLLSRMVVFHPAPPSAPFRSDVEILSLPFKGAALLALPSWLICRLVHVNCLPRQSSPAQERRQFLSACANSARIHSSRTFTHDSNNHAFAASG